MVQLSMGAIATRGISVTGLVKSYRGSRVPALRDVSLDVHAGETLGLIGPNGAGKTTFFGCLLGLLTPDRGTILIDGESPSAMSVRRKLGYVPERQTFDDWMTGRQFLAYHHGLAERPKRDRTREVEEAFDRVGLERSAFDRRVKRFSRGMLQRLGLAQALLGRPSYLFLDEPTSGVDPPGALLVRRILDELKAQGTTIIVNSHQLDQLERVCDRVAFIRNGQLDSVQRVDEVADAARTVALRFLAQAGDAERITNAIADGITLLASTITTAQLAIPDDDACAALVARLIASGLKLVEVVPRGGRLERLFHAPAAGSDA
jgi:ABC-2 type transport system ATP-binding protein